MKVFLSSTYLDLIEHRKAVVTALRTMGEEVEHMEIFGARDEEPTKASLEELDKCDVLVGVYAYRYGTIPKGTKTSVTEQEYHHATELGIPILVFVIDEDHHWHPKLIDKSLTKVNNFKSKIKKEHTPDYYTFPDTLAAKVVASIGRLAKKINAKANLSDSITEPRKASASSTLPSQPFFFGREEELLIISDAISPDSRTWGVLIDGPGGIGKTALAIEAAHRAPSELFEIKIFISAKERELTSRGEISSKEFSQTSFLSILNEIALQLGEDGILRVDPEKRANAIRLAIASKKTLIILDNLETLNNDDREYIYQFLNRLPQGSKAIVTSRRRDETDARTIRLDELKESEAEKLIMELAKRNPRLHEISDTDKKELFFTASGNPLIIRWIIGQVGRSESNIKTITEAIKFLRQAPNDNDPLEYVFGDLVASLTPSELNILVAMTYFSQSPKAEWIANISERSENTIDTVWDELANRSILTVNKVSKQYFLPPLTKHFIQKRLRKEISDMEDKFVNYARQKALEFGAKNNINGLVNLENYWPLISASLPYFIRKENNELQILCDVLDTFLKSTGLRDEWLWLNTQAGLNAELNYDHEVASERSYKIGLIYSYLEKPKEVLQYALRTETNWNEVKSDKEPNKGIIYSNHLRGISHKLVGDYDSATKTITEALTLAKENTPFQILIRASLLNTLGEIQIKEGEAGNSKEKFQFAEKNFEEALLIALENGNKEEIAVFKGNLANLHLKQGQWQKAELFASDALRIVEEIGLQEEIARNNLYLAIAYLNLNSGGPKGLRASKKAVAIYRRLRHKDLSIAEAILTEWEK